MTEKSEAEAVSLRSGLGSLRRELHINRPQKVSPDARYLYASVWPCPQDVGLGCQQAQKSSSLHMERTPPEGSGARCWGDAPPSTGAPMSWRGQQPAADRADAVAWAERLQTDTYTCRVCGWLRHQNGYGYDLLMQVCGTCAVRINNLYHRKHADDWFHRESATDADLAYWGEDREPRPVPVVPAYTKAKIKTALRLKIYERDGFKCVYCGSRKDLSLDHVKAESEGGATTDGNLVTACKTCNSRKKTKSLADFWEMRK